MAAVAYALPTTKEMLDNEPTQIAAQQWGGYQRARDAGHMKYVEEAKLYDRYYIGDQWEEAIARELDRQMRPHHTINMVLSTLNTVTGRYVAMRQDIEYKPTRPPARCPRSRSGSRSRSSWMAAFRIAGSLISDST